MWKIHMADHSLPRLIEAIEARIEPCGALGFYDHVFSTDAATGKLFTKSSLIESLAPGTWRQVSFEKQSTSNSTDEDR